MMQIRFLSDYADVLPIRIRQCCLSCRIISNYADVF